MVVQACPPPTPCVPGVVVFVPADFKTQYPAFATVADAALQTSFDLATLQLNNGCCSRVSNPNIRESLLNLLTAHITALKDGSNGQPPPGIVGRVNTATEGSVSVGADMGAMAYGQAYYMQTQWGALYWQSTAQFRQMVYVPAPPVCADFNGGIGFPGSFWPNGGYGGDGGYGGGGCC